MIVKLYPAELAVLQTLMMTLRTLLNSFKTHKRALVSLWITFSSLMLIVMILFLFPARTSLLALIPECEWQAKYGQECLLCGMTTAFTFISMGDFKAAHQAHKNSLTLYSLMLTNQLILTIFLLKKYRPVLAKKAT